MGFDHKYGQIVTEFGDIPPDEPVVVLRGRDLIVPTVLAYYGMQCLEAGSPMRHLRLIAESYQLIRQWQQDHPADTKIPDSERSREWMGDPPS